MKKILGGLTLFLAAAAFTLAVVLPVTRTAAQVGSEELPIYLPILVKPGTPPEEPPDPIPGSSSGALSPGGAFETTAGVGISTLADTITDPITATIAGVPAPAQTLPSQAQTLGHYFEMKADRKVLTQPESPFIVAFPVPTGANTGNLALAVLESGEGALEVDSTVRSWAFVDGFYDSGAGKFLTTLSSLEDTGRTFVLVEHPDFVSPLNTRAPWE